MGLKQPNRARGLRQGQTSIELTVSLLLLMMLLVAAARVFVWLNEGLVDRNSLYKGTRLRGDGFDHDKSLHPNLNLIVGSN